MATLPSSPPGPADSSARPKQPATGYYVYGRAPDGRRWFVTATEADAEIVLRLSATGGRKADLYLTDRERAPECLDRQAAVSLASTLNALNLGYAWTATDGLPW